MLHQNWGLGHLHLGQVEHDSIQYVAKYIDKKWSGDLAFQEYTQKNREPVFKTGSQGIGLQYALKHQKQIKQMGYITQDGIKQSIPRYYCQKLNIDLEEIKQIAKQQEYKLIRHMSNIDDLEDMSFDEFYMKYSAREVYALDARLKKYRLHKDRTIRARIAQNKNYSRDF